MEDVKVLDVTESATVGRWVLATVERYDGIPYQELTFAPDLTALEWARIVWHLPESYRIVWLHEVPGDMLGRRRALMATIL